MAGTELHGSDIRRMCLEVNQARFRIWALPLISCVTPGKTLSVFCKVDLMAPSSEGWLGRCHGQSICHSAWHTAGTHMLLLLLHFYLLLREIWCLEIHGHTHVPWDSKSQMQHGMRGAM